MTLDLDSYHKNGFLVFPGFVSDTSINSLIKSLTWLVKAQLAAIGADLPASAVSRHQNPINVLSDLMIYLKKLSAERQGFVYDQVNRLPWMHNFASSEPLINFARQILSENIAIHSRLNIVMSLPGEEWHLARWHQDSFYNQSNHLVAYVPLQKATPDNGSLRIAEGNHLDGLLPHDDIRTDNKWIAINNSVVSGFKNVRMLDLEKGDLLLFNGNLPHTATFNNSDCVRFAITIRFSNLEDEFFLSRGWVWQDLSIKGANALKSKKQVQ